MKQSPLTGPYEPRRRHRRQITWRIHRIPFFTSLFTLGLVVGGGLPWWVMILMFFASLRINES